MMCRQAVKPLWVLGLFVVCCQSLLSGASAQERGLAYSPYSSDKNNFCLSASEVARDLKILAQYTSYLRLYGVAACLPATQQILAFAEKNSMRVMLGLWIGSDSKSNEEELAALPGLLSSYIGVIQSVAVGNEPVSFLGLEPSFVLPLVKRGRDLVKRVSSIPVTSVEIASVWDKVSEQGSYAAQLLPEIDFVGVNAHPYFEGLPATCQGLNITGCYDAATWAVQRVQGLQKSLGKRVVLAETGFPTAGERCCNYRPSGFPSSAPLFMAAPSVAASAAMLASFVSQAAFAGISYYYFEPFDADWKRTYAPCSFCSPLDSCSNGQCTYEYNWGLMTADRVPKSGMPLSLLVPSSLQPAPSSSLPAAPPATLPSPSPAQSPPFQSAPAPASSASPTPSGYFIATQPPSDWQSASQACSRSGARLAAFSSDSDRAGVSALLGGGRGQAQSAWVQEDTVGGQCPLVTPSSSGASLNRANCFDPKRPAVCYAAPSSGSNDGSWLAQVPLYSPAATQPALDTAQPLTQPFQLPQFSSGNQMFQIPIPQVLAVSQPEATPAIQSQTQIIGGVRYQLITQTQDFNSLAAFRQGCPSGTTFSSFSGTDKEAALALAPGLAIWVNENTQNGQVPYKTTSDQLAYQNTQLLPFICKG